VVAWTPPVFDDAETYGAAAARHAIDATRAWGREPVGASALASLPEDLPVRVARAIHRGAESVWYAHGIPVQWGPPQSGPLIYGFAVQARARSRGRARGARPGDRVFASRALGADVLVEAHRRGTRTAAQTRSWVRAATQVDADGSGRWRAAGAARPVGAGGLARACLELATAWDLDVVLDAARLPVLPGVMEHLLAGIRAPSGEANRQACGAAVAVARGVPEAAAQLAFSAEWTGGVTWVEARRGDAGIGELRRKRGRRPMVRLMPELDLPSPEH